MGLTERRLGLAGNYEGASSQGASLGAGNSRASAIGENWTTKRRRLLTMTIVDV